MISCTSRPLAVAAALVVLTTGVLLPAPAAEAGVAKTTACTFVPVGDGGSEPDTPPAVDRYETPSAVPPGATAFTSPDGFGGRQYMLGPSNGTCVAHGGMDLDFNQQITLGGHDTPAFEQVFGAGGDYQLGHGCRYLPTIRRFADPLSPQDCIAAPPTEHIQILNTGMPNLPAALVTVERNVTDRQLRTTGANPVLAVVLAFDRGTNPGDPTYRIVTTSYADCQLSAATTGICLASLQTFIDEAITFQQSAVPFPIHGDPGAKIRDAVAHYGHPPARHRTRHVGAGR